MPETLTPSQLKLWFDVALPFAQNLLLAIVILGIGWVTSRWVQGWIRKAGERGSLDPAIAGFLSQIGRYAVFAAFIISALARVGVETTSVVAIFASAGLAVGLALQGSLASFASGVLILFFRPFTLGDIVTTAGNTGRVVDIGLFATRLETPDNQRIIIPNSAITSGTIINLTVMGERRLGVDLGVAYGSDLNLLKSTVEAAVAKMEVVKSEPGREPELRFIEMAASSINFRLMYWVDATPAALNTSGFAVRKTIYDAINAAGIEIPFDQIVSHKAEG